MAWEKFSVRQRERAALLGVLALAAGLIFFRLTRADVQTDAGHYATRAVGYFDFLDSTMQTTPLQWFAPSSTPLWTKLSFHDHPPLVFGIQHVFFLLFGVSDLVAVLPFAVSGLAAVFLVYVIGRRLANPLVGAGAALLLAVATFFTWSSRIGYLESVENAFILLSVWLFLRAERDERWLPAWGVGVGLAILCKYSAMFLVPMFLCYIVLRRRQWFAQPKFWLACLAVLVVLSPVIVYNIETWRARGHLDVQLSTLVPAARSAAQKDWPVMFSGPRTVNVAVNVRDLTRSLRLAFSKPFALLLAIGVLMLMGRAVRRSRARADVLVGLGLFFLAAFFSFTAPSLRYLPIVVPWLCLAAALGLDQLRAGAAATKWRTAGVIVLGVVITVELFFNWNTNHALRAYGEPGVHYAAYRQESLGFQQLAAYLRSELAANPNFHTSITVPQTFDEWRLGSIHSGDDVLMYDDGLLWFSTYWYLRSFQLYHQLRTYMMPVDMQGSELLESWPEVFGNVGVRHAYYVTGLQPYVYDPWAAALGDKYAGRIMARTIQQLIEERRMPGRITDIKNRQGVPVFRVFEIPFSS
ncbi:MAG: glycosyltransferase family 39 protein [Patescibacteria group bacterium]|nr:glycosyltransferase family 39 protein [Patescibacteria group bacterium]